MEKLSDGGLYYPLIWIYCCPLTDQRRTRSVCFKPPLCVPTFFLGLLSPLFVGAGRRGYKRPTGEGFDLGGPCSAVDASAG